ncbi:inclusion membrane protein IncD [Chlamydia caviae]|uniref:Uncharacterized protein n=1 Tax=Chlamydia caviae (strain ATCC VR-813 / DSM 19441 / 03DC25 / GPIC) TaxID=227941 RepID=Q822Q7_CHLCV|nr:inclusion membrane protein IncD [Chlamydia caviae]AAP05364.1 hypothetical protein CCA_00622 [Chlamydia caviae GPIC]
MRVNIEKTVTSVQMSSQQIRSKCDNLTAEISKMRVVPTYRVGIEIAAAILGAVCLILAAIVAAGVLAVGCICLMPLAFSLGSALLTFAVTSVVLRQGELRRERCWRSHALRWNSFANDLYTALETARQKRSPRLPSSVSAQSC